MTTTVRTPITPDERDSNVNITPLVVANVRSLWGDAAADALIARALR